MGPKIRRGDTGTFARPVQILVLTILILILQPITIHILNISVTSCPLGDNPQILSVQRNFCLCTLFQRNVHILENGVKHFHLSEHTGIRRFKEPGRGKEHLTSGCNIG